MCVISRCTVFLIFIYKGRVCLVPPSRKELNANSVGFFRSFMLFDGRKYCFFETTRINIFGKGKSFEFSIFPFFCGREIFF